jgi:hypothetical protein
MEITMKRAVTSVFVWAILLSGLVGQQPEEPLTVPPGVEIKLTHPADSTATKLAAEKIKNIRLTHELMERAYNDQTAQMNSDIDGYRLQINAWVAKVKKDNGFGDDVTYDSDTDRWYRKTEPSKPDAKAAPVKR